MTSTPDTLKQEPPQDNVPMHSDDDTEQEQGNNSGLSNQTDGSQPSQKDTNQNNGDQPGQINVNQATQNNETQPEQKDTNDVGQNNGNQSTNENPFLSGFFKRKVDKDNSANNARAFSPVVEDPNPKKAKIDHSFSFNPSAKAKTAPFSPRAQTTTRTSPFPEDDGVWRP
ncbi:hypothetical protein BKA60DRAFT_602979 [Fusarium oxysporum]|nr:hypothetical protein BKA60DRAFT_602979 [Fusarium oxysporum]